MLLAYFEVNLIPFANREIKKIWPQGNLEKGKIYNLVRPEFFISCYTVDFLIMHSDGKIYMLLWGLFGSCCVIDNGKFSTETPNILSRRNFVPTSFGVILCPGAAARSPQ